ncbi:MAG: FliA/WhiG family RNA polymerase sigma factor [Butyrivibrio sp.]|uniref:FliA/WhiG family RNA polymerase sigma factor n=1 Tax=Butyrivibrio sp. TaxID=28121 RepID=UPI001B6AFD72|nr:FliA/WhiG family RNA polymerase sigma factor [Butyrivibrio sp.]MBP3275189.1 FliA/WhiG family RNA polymerase sigma factor [Butyrivibrio sp.]MBP3277500.1 FliA/WhiG family RNA polymerase sigma factor [Butyrivibrio sp.]MBP3784152.1 FliA/WhiG family RNA polymerase sigma factor [Butyrivibrio sp.]MBP3813586.1 FliA/WhiG family RNA polymerase sigma factor [Butyrivibrio sp.]
MDEAGRNKLWTDYNKSKSADIREQLILEYAPLVKLVAGRLSMYLGFNVEYDDLVGYGIFGLIDAIDKFDLMKDVKFETYASLRIRGAILDQIRKMDWIPRTIRQRQKKIEAAIREIEKDGGHVATDAEIAAKMEISEDEYQNWQNQMKVTGVVSLNEFMDQGADIPEDSNNRSSSFVKPEEAVEKEELKKMLAESLELLTDKEKKVILLYYYEELTLKEISEVLEVSESRVSQLHTRALQKMREKLGNYLGILTNSR